MPLPAKKQSMYFPPRFFCAANCTPDIVNRFHAFNRNKGEFKDMRSEFVGHRFIEPQMEMARTQVVPFFGMRMPFTRSERANSL